MTRFLLVFVALAVVAGVDATCAKLALSQDDCYVVAPIEQSFGCRPAAFGAFLPSDSERRLLPLRIASDNSLACSGQQLDTVENAVVLVRRGGCDFQQKLVHVAAAGGVGMVLINTDDSSLQLGTLQYESLEAFAVSVKRSEGDRLVSLVQNASDTVTISIRSNQTALDQAWHRIEYLMEINAPLVAYETFYAALPPPTRDLDTLIESILELRTKPHQVKWAHHTIEFLLRCADVFPYHWEFTRDASFHAAVGAAALLMHQSLVGEASLLSASRLGGLKAGAIQLLGRGYYAHAARLLERLPDDDSDQAARCLLAFVHFLRGDIFTALEEAHDCHARASQFNVTSAGLDVPHDNFLRLVVTEMDGQTDHHCVAALTSQAISVPGALTHNTCCRRRIHGHTDEAFDGDDDDAQRPAKISRRAYWYHSDFVKELHHTLHIMGVFLDELGGFHESVVFFRHAAQLCEDWSLSSEFRAALALPIVFDSTATMHGYLAQLHHHIEDLRSLRAKQNRILSSLTGVDAYANIMARPEDATYLQYTITPPSMFIGYQGVDVLPLQQAVFALRAELFPSLTSRFRPLNELFVAHTETPRRRRIAFVSTWFRNHSVGKLLLGIIQRLDRSQFHVMVYRSVHFLKASDELTKEFRRAADSYLELPVHLDAAVALLRHEAIDILIYPEQGMDAWTLFLSHHRIAPVQCVFWGHPVTTANPAIDYFLTSEYFISDFYEGSNNEEDEKTSVDAGAWPGTYHGSLFSEQVVLFRGLSTFFTNRFPTVGSRGVERSKLQLPSNARLYVCPQTLMKLHTDFDAVLEAILTRDSHARIVLLASASQRVWKEQLQRRFRRRFGEAHRRVLFLSTLPYDDFMGLLSMADVVLDPFPFGGGVTTLDVFAVGTPVVTLPSAQTVPQLAAGFLRAMGMTDTIASSIDGFVSMALEIAHNATLRTRVRDRILARHDALYEDETTLEDWNAFLASVDIDIPRAEEP